MKMVNLTNMTKKRLANHPALQHIRNQDVNPVAGTTVNFDLCAPSLAYFHKTLIDNRLQIYYLAQPPAWKPTMQTSQFSKFLLLQAVTLFILGVTSTCMAAGRKPINTVPKNGFEFAEPVSQPEPAKLTAPKPTVQKETATSNGEKAAKTGAVAKPSRTKGTVSQREQAKPVRDEDELKLPHSIDGRFCQLRGGPRLARVYGTLRPGPEGGSNIDLRDELGLTDTDTGPQLDFELRFSDRAYGRVVFTSDHFEGSTVSSRALNYIQTGRFWAPVTILPAGSPISSKLELNLLQTILGYDIVQTDSFSLGVLAGAKTLFSDATFSTFTNGLPFTRNIRVDEVTPLVGLEFRAQLGPHVYVGLAPVGFAWENFSYAGGQGFIGYDFNKTFGVRLGMDFDHLTVSRGTGPLYSLSDATLAAAFIQGVFGY